MKTKYKILIIVTTTLFVYIVLRMGIIHLCNAVSDECKIYYDFLEFTSLHVPSYGIWESGGGAGEWSGTAESPEFAIDYSWYLTKNINFVLFFVAIPICAIMAILYKDKK